MGGAQTFSYYEARHTSAELGLVQFVDIACCASVLIPAKGVKRFGEGAAPGTERGDRKNKRTPPQASNNTGNRMARHTMITMRFVRLVNIA